MVGQQSVPRSWEDDGALNPREAGNRDVEGSQANVSQFT